GGKRRGRRPPLLSLAKPRSTAIVGARAVRPALSRNGPWEKLMPYLIDATDKPDSTALRAAERPQHMAYLDGNLARLIAAGAKLRDDGETAWGSLYLIDVDDRAAAEAFINNDPFQKAGLFGKVEISRWRKAFLDGKKMPPKT